MSPNSKNAAEKPAPEKERPASGPSADPAQPELSGEGRLRQALAKIAAGRYGPKRLLRQALQDLEAARRDARAAGAPEPDERFSLASAEAWLYLQQYDAAEPLLKQSLAAGSPDQALSIRALIGLSHLSEQKNDFSAALDYASDALARFDAAGLADDALKTDLFFQLSQVHLRRQDYAAMEEFIPVILEVSRRLGAVEKEALALCNLAVARSVQSDYKAAMPLFIESLEKSRPIGFRYNEANCLINIGTIYAQLFNYEDALDRYHIVLSEYKDALSDNTLIAIQNNMGNIYFTLEQYEESLFHFSESLLMAQGASYKEMIAHTLSQKCRVYLALGDFDRAAENARQSSDLIRELDGKVNGKQIHLLNLAEIAAADRDFIRAKSLVKKGIALARRLNDVVSELRGFLTLSGIYQTEQDFLSALKCLRIHSAMQAGYAKTQRNMRMIDLEIKYSLQEKQRKIEELTKENEYQALLLDQSSQMAQQNTKLLHANEELRQFAYITSHDLKEPLRMIGSFTQIIRQQFAPQLGDEAETYFQYVKEGVTRMNSLLDGLLQYATIGKSDMDRDFVNLNEVLRIACANLKLAIEESEARIRYQELPVVHSVASLLIQLMQNLIGNAVKFRKPDVPPDIQILSEERADHYQIAVADNGVGVGPEHFDRIFVIFQRLHTRAQYEGTGLGLAICQKIVQQLGGKIWVESEKGQGATFYFTLPK